MLDLVIEYAVAIPIDSPRNVEIVEIKKLCLNASIQRLFWKNSKNHLVDHFSVGRVRKESGEKAINAVKAIGKLKVKRKISHTNWRTFVFIFQIA